MYVFNGPTQIWSQTTQLSANFCPIYQNFQNAANCPAHCFEAGKLHGVKHKQHLNWKITAISFQCNKTSITYQTSFLSTSKKTPCQRRESNNMKMASRNQRNPAAGINRGLNDGPWDRAEAHGIFDQTKLKGDVPGGELLNEVPFPGSCIFCSSEI